MGCPTSLWLNTWSIDNLFELDKRTWKPFQSANISSIGKRLQPVDCLATSYIASTEYTACVGHPYDNRSGWGALSPSPFQPTNLTTFRPKSPQNSWLPSDTISSSSLYGLLHTRPLHLRLYSLSMPFSSPFRIVSHGGPSKRVLLAPLPPLCPKSALCVHMAKINSTKLS